MAIQVYDMGLDFTKGEGTSISDFRLKQAQANQADATANKYKAENDEKQKASALHQTRGAALREAVKQFPDSEDEQFSYLLGAAGANGDTEFHDATLKQRAEFRKGRDEQKKANEDNTVALQKRHSPKFADLERDPSNENIERHIEDLTVTDPAAAEKLQEMYEANPDMPPEERSKRFGEMVHPDYRTLKYNQSKKVSIDLNGKTIRIPETQAGEWDKILTLKQQWDIDNPGSNKTANPYYNFIPGPDGRIIVGNARTGVLEEGADPATGEPFVAGKLDPDTQKRVSYGKSKGAYLGEKDAAAEYSLPDAQLGADYIINILDQAVGSPDGKIPQHKGFSGYVGATLTPGYRLLEGSPESSFEALHKQIRGSAFKEAFKTLRGGGNISNTEGEAATQALTRLDKAISEKEYKKAAGEFRAEVKKLLKLAKKRAAVNRFVKKGKSKQESPKAFDADKEARYQEYLKRKQQ